jgi:hypothetical protein
VSIENNTGGIQFFGANFCPQIDGSVNLGVPTFRWNQLFTLAAAIGTTTVDFAQYKLEVGTGMRVIGNNGIRLINSNVDGGGGIAPGAGAGGGLGITGDAGPLTFGAGGLERMRIDTAGNVGIGDSPPVNTLSIMGNSSETTVGGRAKSIVFNNFTQTGGGGNDIVWQAANTATMRWAAISGQITSNSGATAGGQLLFSTGEGAGLQSRMLIDAVGNVLFGTSFNNFPTLILDGFSGGRPVVAFKRSGTQIWGTYMNTDAGPGTDPYCISTPSETIGQRLSSTVSGSWQTMSDERIKTDLLSITDALNKVASLRAITYRLIDGPTPERSVGLIAQDVQAVLPEAVSPGIVGSVNGVGGVERLWLSYTAVIPLLVAAIKELNAKVDAL